MDGLLESNFQKARDLLNEARYDGTPVVLLHSTDLVVLNNLAPVAKSLMERAGLKVDMQSMDWQTLEARRAKKDSGLKLQLSKAGRYSTEPTSPSGCVSRFCGRDRPPEMEGQVV